ncbi:LysM peptidoglycan-binding domain-containing protein [Caldichromatium japonicum]|uniref:LysM peptidoglycan-binding domain-containing protein n=1 Tax=Caldichromatium japonicum TaxID=2699430 RepID=A0A6G7VBW6_9GAMM|nr:LysM domain-containing protein [Caldichromatium japonicum]QIK37287.1 LysM peptidoglycan-binding domain-containing protein [Caldichromatium japonicum]
MQSRFAILSVFSIVLTLFAGATPALELAPDAPSRYVVQPGDTLWDIAGRFLNEPWRWSEVWQANPGIDNPNRIYPGDVLELAQVAGRPVIRRAAGVRTVRLSPQVRAETLKAPIPVIRIGNIAPFLTQPYVADSDAIKQASYVVGFPEEHIVAGVRDSIYVRKIPSAEMQQFQVLRPGDPLRDPESSELLGYHVEFIANAVLERPGNPAKLRVTRMEREVSIGDRVIPADPESALADFLPRPAPTGLRGRILAVTNGVSQIGRYDVVILNRGARDGLEPGHVFEVFSGGERERDQVRSGIANSNWLMDSPFSSEFWLGYSYEFKGWRADEPSANEGFPLHPAYRRQKAEYIAPFERAGRLMVFRVFDRVSFGVILEATRALQVGNWIAPPSA